jgi:hypothetical protein
VTVDEKDALQGTDGTPDDSNRFVTNTDDRVTLSDATPIAIEPDDAGSPGTGSQPSREDHQHEITCAAPTQGIGASNDEGTAGAFSRADHDHLIRTTDGPTDLAIGSIEDDQGLKRSGTSIIGVDLLNPDRAIVVAKTALGAHATSIDDAITLANALSPAPSSSAPAVIVVYPGVYTTDAFFLPDYVNLVGVGGKEAVIIEASTTTLPLCGANGGQRIEGLTFRNASGSGGIGIEVVGTTGTLYLRDLLIGNCETAIQCDGSAYSVDIDHVSCENGVTGAYVDGAGAVAQINNLTLSDFITGLHVGSTGGTVTGTFLRCVDDSAFTTHVQVEAASSVLALVNSIFRDDKTDFNASAEISAQHVSHVPGDEAVHFGSELHVGSEVRPRESCFGGGESHTRGLAVFTNTSLEAGTWADITDNLKYVDAAYSTLFAGVGADNCCYIGGDYQFPGIKPLITTAMDLGTGSVIAEYWNGSAWTEFYHMSTSGNGAWSQYALDLWTRAADEQIRFDTSIFSAWATKDLNGTTKYWVRVRIVTAITTAPEADVCKLHTHRTEINSDGVVEFFGDAEPHRDLVWDIALEGRQDGFDPKDADSSIASGVDWKNRDNDFIDAEYLGKLSGIRVAQGWDTSRELTYIFGWHPRSGATLTGDVEIQVDGYIFQSGDQFDGTKTPDFSESEIIDVSTLADAEMVLTSFTFRIPSMVPGDLLVMHIYRDATAANLDDTFSDDVTQFLAALQGVVWRT